MKFLLNSSVILQVLVVYFICINAEKFQLSLYSNVNYTGESVEFYHTQTDIECITEIVALGEGFRSYCYTGSWRLSRPGSTLGVSPSPSRTCFRMPSGFEKVTGVYRQGPEDTTTTSITFGWSDPTNGITTVEQEDSNLAITSTVIPLSSVYTVGLSSWELFENENFQGRKTCLTPTAQLQKYPANQLGLPSIGSVSKGCS